MNNANWPIRVGGMYPCSGRSPLCFIVKAIDGNRIYFVHYDPRYSEADGREFGEMDMDADGFRAQAVPEDQSPIPDLLELAQAVAVHFEDTDAPLGVMARTVLAKVECEVQRRIDRALALAVTAPEMREEVAHG